MSVVEFLTFHVPVDEVDEWLEWASLEQWKAVPPGQLAALSEAMGRYEREATCASFEVLRSRR